MRLSAHLCGINRSSCVACLPARLHQGSERVLRTEVSGQRLKEAQSINKSVVFEISGVGGLRVGGGARSINPVTVFAATSIESVGQRLSLQTSLSAIIPRPACPYPCGARGASVCFPMRRVNPWVCTVCVQVAVGTGRRHCCPQERLVPRPVPQLQAHIPAQGLAWGRCKGRQHGAVGSAETPCRRPLVSPTTIGCSLLSTKRGGAWSVAYGR
jgi:hypothetical protein